MRAARSICQRGVALVATAHAGSLAALLSNFELNALLGGVHEVILGDQALAMRRGSGGDGGRGAFARRAEAKTRQERRGPPMFQHAIELRSAGSGGTGDRDRGVSVRVHWDVAESVDALLEGRRPPAEERTIVDGQVYTSWGAGGGAGCPLAATNGCR